MEKLLNNIAREFYEHKLQHYACPQHIELGLRQKSLLNDPLTKLFETNLETGKDTIMGLEITWNYSLADHFLIR